MAALFPLTSWLAIFQPGKSSVILLSLHSLVQGIKICALQLFSRGGKANFRNSLKCHQPPPKLSLWKSDFSNLRMCFFVLYSASFPTSCWYQDIAPCLRSLQMIITACRRTPPPEHCPFLLLRGECSCVFP